jgi:hypothetical protein
MEYQIALLIENLSEEARKAIQELPRPGLYTVLRKGRFSVPYRILSQAVRSNLHAIVMSERHERCAKA